LTDRTGWEDQTVIGGKLIKLVLFGLFLLGLLMFFGGWLLLADQGNPDANQTGRGIIFVAILFVAIALAGLFFGRKYLQDQ
jgi:hypothetical protein